MTNIEGEAVLRQKLEYIHQNPVKWGYVEEAVHWRWSSARSYAGGEGDGGGIYRLVSLWSGVTRNLCLIRLQRVGIDKAPPY